MNFDDDKLIQLVDKSNYVSEIRTLNVSLLAGWEFGKAQSFSLEIPINKIILVGFSEFLNTIEILLSIIGEKCNAPIVVHNSSSLPVWCKGKENLIIGLIRPSNEIYIKQIINEAEVNQCSIFTLHSENKKPQVYPTKRIGELNLPEKSFARSTVGFDVMMLFGLFYNLGFVSDISDQLNQVQDSLQKTLNLIDISVPSSLNPAKRLAGQMVGRWIKIVGGGKTKPIAQHWSDQINKSSKTMAWSEDIHQLVNQSLSGIYNPVVIVQQSMVVFLKSTLNTARIELLIDKSKEELMCNGVGTDYYLLRGKTQFEQIWNSILFGDYVAYYLAMAYQFDPGPTAVLDI